MNRLKTWTWLFCSTVLLLSAAVLPASAQDSDDRRDDPPGRVARMNYTQGSVSFQPGGEGDWVEAVPNRPMTTGDNLWVDRNSRAELHVGSTAIRLNSETSLTFLDLDDRTTQLRLAQGSVILNVRHLDDDDTVEIDTPNLSFQVQHNGEYRLDVNPDGQTTVVDVIHGRGEVIGGGNSYAVVANQEATFRGGADQDNQQLNYDIQTLPSDDDFDHWSFDRDRREDRSESASYVSREMTGYEDLDENGSWVYDANYGHVWIPTAVESGWAPYREGHWAFIAPWGWTWVDDARWGFAPFHYGRWCRVRDRWAWVPGPVIVRPVYAPALVVFVGGGGFHLSVGFGGGGGVAWFPLGPGEVFVPSYHVSRTYVNQVNVTNTVVNVTKITNVYNNTNVVNNVTKIVYVNQRAPNAVTAVSRETFVNARPVSRNVMQISQREVEQAPVTHVTGVEPVRTSVMGSGRPTRIAPPPAVANRQVVAQRTPSQPPVPFTQRQDPLVTHPARPMATPGTGQPMPPHQLPPNPARPEPDVPPVAGQPMPPHQLPPNPARPEADVPRPNQPGITQPGMNQPVNRRPNPRRPESDVPRPSAAQPLPETSRPEVSRPEVSRPETPRPDVPRPGVNRPDAGQPESSRMPQPARSAEPARAPEPNTEARPQQGWSHPLARPAAPVQPKSEQQGRDEERKFNQWQEKQRTAPPRPPAREEAPRNNRDDKEKEKKHN